MPRGHKLSHIEIQQFTSSSSWFAMKHEYATPFSDSLDEFV